MMIKSHEIRYILSRRTHRSVIMNEEGFADRRFFFRIRGGYVDIMLGGEEVVHPERAAVTMRKSFEIEKPSVVPADEMATEALSGDWEYVMWHCQL